MNVVWRRKPLRNHLSTQTNLPPAVNGAEARQPTQALGKRAGAGNLV